MLKQLKYFQSVVRLKSFSEAAEENYISQSAISQQVQALERELGFSLLERKNRSFTLMLAGEYFYRKSLILTAADPQHSAADETLADFRGYLRCLPGAKEAGVIFGTGTWDKGDVYRHPALKQAYEMGRSI